MTCVSILYNEKEEAVEGEDLGEGNGSDGGEGWVACGSREGEIYIWRLAEGRFSLSQQIPAHIRQVHLYVWYCALTSDTLPLSSF